MAGPRVAAGDRVALIAAGERWPDGSLRPAVEDLWGAGAVLAAMREQIGEAGWSPEAVVAADAFGSAAVSGASGPSLAERLREVASGRELVDAGFADDVAAAAAYDSSAVVAVLVDDVFVAQPRATGDVKWGRPSSGFGDSSSDRSRVPPGPSV